MVYALLVHSVLPNPQLLTLGALLQQFQVMTVSNAGFLPGTPSTPSGSSSLVFNSKFPFTPSKSIAVGLASPASVAITSSASNALPNPASNLFVPGSNSAPPTLTFNGITLSPAQTGSSGGPPENVTMFLSQFFDDFEGQPSVSEPLGQAIALQTAIHFYQYKQLQVGAYTTAVQDELKRRKNPNAVVPPSPASNFDSVWASPALQISGDAIPSFDGVFTLPPNDITKQPLTVVWRHCDACLFSLVCYEDENQLLALNFLQNLPKLMQDQYRVTQICQNPRDIMMRPEELLTIINTFLPKGLLQTVPNSLMRQLKRESDATFQ